MTLGLGGVGEDAGGLDHDVDTQVTPGQGGRAFLDLEGLDLGVADDDGVVAFEADLVGQPPRMESNFSRCARLALSVRSLTATISMSVLLPRAFCASNALKKFRPMRPKPFTPTRTVTALSLCL